MTAHDLMTDRERLDAITPTLWALATSLDPDSDFTELQLAALTYQAANRAASRWRPDGLDWPDYAAMAVTFAIAKARDEGHWEHSAERMLDTLTAGA